MLYIRNNGDGKAGLTTDQYLAFVKQCELYISQLKANSNLLAAQPLGRAGVVIAKNKEEWTETTIDAGNEIQVGYYHISAQNIEEAIAIAKCNAEFEYVPLASIEVRPKKMKEEQTGFIYPTAK